MILYRIVLAMHIAFANDKPTSSKLSEGLLALVNIQLHIGSPVLQDLHKVPHDEQNLNN